MKHILRALVISALLVVGFDVSDAAAAPGDECIPVTGATIPVKTVPTVPLFAFTVDGVPFATGPDGTVRIPSALCGELVPVETTRDLGSGTRLRFQRWHGGRSGGYTATFYTDRQVRLRYQDPDGAPYPRRLIDRVVLKSSLGVRLRTSATETHWLVGSRAVRRLGGIIEAPVYWTLEDATVSGLNIVTRNQLKFYPLETAEPLARVLVFDASVRARDAFFGLSMGDARLKLVYPDGRVEMHRFDGSGRLRLRNLPRGQYDLTVLTSGLKMKSPVAITRDQEVDLKVLSYLDIAAVVVAGIAIAGGLLLYGRRQRRRRPRERAAERDDSDPDAFLTPTELSEVPS